MSFLLPHGVCSSKKSLHFQAQQAEVVLIGMKALLLSMHCWRTIGIEFSLGPLTLWRSSTGRRRNESLGWQVTPCCFLVQIELYGAPLHHKVNQPPLGANGFTSFQISRSIHGALKYYFKNLPFQWPEFSAKFWGFFPAASFVDQKHLSEGFVFIHLIVGTFGSKVANSVFFCHHVNSVSRVFSAEGMEYKAFLLGDSKWPNLIFKLGVD